MAELTVAGLTVEIRRTDGRAAVCTVAGDLEIDTLAPAEKALTALVGAGPPVLVVDLERVGFCDSSGLNLLLKTRLAAQAAGIDLRLAAPGPMVTRVLELTGARAVFSVHDSVRAALAGAAGD
ncbi:STAS domain-containing protein [Kitasatospora paracochleata]|uniref:Anti-sigma factor antagonist n=1 Tax=Kitasatospora paracochleata TaxID=58354 RepID=A0ABT1J3H5_9ACTN|nr:STAS domain-containing protein [Kitasatospora paracochleata]MCP2311794.1 anti-sigma B factor antagonist [Kitasatospora paracochleata]